LRTSKREGPFPMSRSPNGCVANGFSAPPSKVGRIRPVPSR
jgi:hypothetical protein